MKTMRHKKIFLIVAIAAFMVLLFNSNTAIAAVNVEYSNTDAVPDDYLTESFEDSTMLNLLAKLIFAAGRFLEWILGTIFNLLTGSTDFPWADKIVFNAVPLLDINFINPDSHSFVGNSNMKEVLRNLYATILTLAAAFFGIVVLITAIKLVITTIASEKAKYKQAIVDWLIGFVLLFCIHYGISFIFYLNEQLVVVASKMVTTQLNKAEIVAQVQISDLTGALIDSMGESTYSGTYRGKKNVKIKQILKENANIVGTFINLDSEEDSHGLHEFLQKGMSHFGWDVAINNEAQKQGLAAIVVWASSVNVSVSELENIRAYQIYPTTTREWLGNELRTNAGLEGQAITESTFVKIFGNEAAFMINRLNNPELFAGKKNYQTKPRSKVILLNPKYNKDGVVAYWKTIKSNETLYMSKGFGDIGKLEGGWLLLSNAAGEVFSFVESTFTLNFNLCDYDTTYKWTKVVEDLIRLKGASGTNSCSDRDTGDKKKRCAEIEKGEISVAGKTQKIISNLATYFKENARAKEFRTTNKTGLKETGPISIQNMIMYAILVAQSLILFIAYVKRLFYVILLAMMAPVIVVFDFFQKFGK